MQQRNARKTTYNGHRLTLGFRNAAHRTLRELFDLQIHVDTVPRPNDLPQGRYRIVRLLTVPETDTRLAGRGMVFDRISACNPEKDTGKNTELPKEHRRNARPLSAE